MGKQGPCRHCGVTSTPLWRNGPPEKPVLCNACGSRWRTKGTLTNYTPLHCREPLDSDEIEAPKARHISFKPKEQNGHKKKQTNNNTVVGIEHQIPYSDQNFRKIFEGDKSNRSSSGSVISCSESCAKFATTEASDLTGSAQSIVWDTHTLVPSKRRTCVARPNPSPVEKLTKDLYSILHEQQSSNLSGYSEEDLLYGCEAPVGSVDIGHYGGVLIRYPNSKAMDEESEASSIPINDKKAAYPGSASLLVDRECKGTGFSKLKRDQVSHETLDILRHRDSPLSSTDLKDVATLEVFKKHLTHEEQQRLVRYLPSIDNGKLPDSLKGMFQSPQFIESLSYFRQLLLEGIFDLSFSGANEEDRRTLKRLLLLNFSKSKWVEHYNKLKDVNGKNIAGGKKVASVANHIGHLNLTPLKRFRDSQNQQYEELKGDMRSPKRASKSGDSIPTFAGTSLTHEADDFMDIEGACFSPRSLFASPEDDRRSVLGSMMSTGQSSSGGAAAWDQKPVLMGQGFLEKPG